VCFDLFVKINLVKKKTSSKKGEKEKEHKRKQRKTYKPREEPNPDTCHP